MCGRFEMSCTLEMIRREFRISKASLVVVPRYNIAPSQDVLIVVNNEGKRELTSCRWGFVPSWSKDPSIGNKMINARAESVAEKPSFRVAFRRHRCLVVTSGFYEWKTEGKTKTPFYIHLKSGKPFGIAGLYSHWTSAKGDVMCTCTIITTNANELVSGLHDRMPAIIPKAEEDYWLDPFTCDVDGLQGLLRPYPAQEMEMYQVSPMMNNPAFDSPEARLPLK